MENNIVIERITENWWKLTYVDPQVRRVFFGYTEGEVKGKFNAWLRKGSDSHD
jgi:hypothetical protein